MPFFKERAWLIGLLSLSLVLGVALDVRANDSRIWPWAIWSSPEGQEQLRAVIPVDLATGVALLLASGSWQDLLNNPDDWCKAGSPLARYRRAHEMLLPVFNIAVLLHVATVKQGLDGDWGFAYLFGWIGAAAGNVIACKLFGGISHPLVKVGLAVFLPPVTAGAWSVYGFNSPRILKEGLLTRKEGIPPQSE